MTNSNNSNHDITAHDGSVDPFKSAFDALRSAGIGFEVVGDFDRIAAGTNTFDRAA